MNTPFAMNKTLKGTDKNHISEKIARTGLLTFFSHSASIILRLGSNLILTRLLLPEMFGIMAIAHVFVFIISLVSDIGISQSIIRSKRGNDDRYINTAWTLQVVRGAIICITVALIGLLIYLLNQLQFFPTSSAYNEPSLPAVISLIAISPFISGFISTNVATSQRNMAVSRVVFLELSSQLAGILTMIALAYTYHTIWSLVAGSLFATLTRVSLSHIIFPDGIKNHFSWDKDAFDEIIKFGKWVLVSSLFTGFYLQGDRLILGGLATARDIGFYSIAIMIPVSIAELLGKIAYNVLFPGMSEIHRQSPNEISSYYYKYRLSFDCFTIFLAGFLYSISETIIYILYPPMYSDSGWMLKILALSLAFKAPLLSTAMMFALGKSKFAAQLQSLQAILLVVTFPTFYIAGGLVAALWALVAISVCACIFDIAYRHKNNLVNYAYEFRAYPLIVVGVIVGEAVNTLVLSIFEG